MPGEKRFRENDNLYQWNIQEAACKIIAWV